jgi:hypothetical protein
MPHPGEKEAYQPGTEGVSTGEHQGICPSGIHPGGRVLRRKGSKAIRYATDEAKDTGDMRVCLEDGVHPSGLGVLCRVIQGGGE